MKEKVSLADRITAKLRKLGVGERKAQALAAGLVPIVRAVVRSEVKQREEPLEVLPANKPFRKAKAVKVNGHHLRVDLPVAPMKGIKGIELLRVMDGLTSTATYLAAAVKSEQGILAIRQLYENEYNVKFYPNFEYWGKTQDDLRALGAHNYCQREYYERMRFSTDALDGLLSILADEAKSKSRMKKLVDRFLAVTTQPLLKAFDYLHKKMGVAA